MSANPPVASSAKPSNSKAPLPSKSSDTGAVFIRLFVVAVLCLHLFFFADLWRDIRRGYPDFTVYYTAAKMLRNGQQHQLYDRQVQYEVQKSSTARISSGRGFLPYIHPPFEAIFFFPLAWLSYSQAFVCWTLINLCLLGIIGILLWPFVRNFDPSAWQLGIASLAFFPIFICLLQGQDSILLLLFCVLGLRAFEREKSFLAGCWFALGMFKFQFMLPIVLLTGVLGKRRTMTGFAAVSALLLAISIAAVGWQELLRYPAFTLQVANSTALGGVSAAFAPNLRGLVMGWPGHFSKPVAAALVLLSSAALFLLAAIRGWNAQPQTLRLRFSIAILISLLIAWQTNMHDLTLLFMPLLFTWNHWASNLGSSRRGHNFLLLAILPLLISPFWMALWLNAHRINIVAIPLLYWVWALNQPGRTAVESTSGST